MDLNFAFVMLVTVLGVVGIAAGIAAVVVASAAILQRMEHKSLQRLTVALAVAKSELEDGH